MKSIPIILVSIGLAIAGQLLLKVGMDRIGKVGFERLAMSLTKMATSPIIITGLIFYAVSAVLWMVVLSHVNLSYAYPFLGITLGAILILSNFLLHEEIPLTRWVGVAVIYLGVLISARQ